MASVFDHTNILRCPVTAESLTRLPPDGLDLLNGSMPGGEVRRLDRTPVGRPLTAALVTESGRLVYEVRDEIAILLPSAAIRQSIDGVEGGRGEEGWTQSLGEYEHESRKAAVRSFYDETGWKREAGDYGDARLFIDRRPPVARYQERCAARITETLRDGGRYLLDAASGPVPHGPNTEYARPFEFHVCVDISITALREAKRNLGEKGIYVLGDVTALPIASDAMDGVASLHTIYHVPRDQQQQAFLELHRTLSPGGRAAIAYNWGRHATAINIMTLPIQLARVIYKRLPFLQRGTSKDIGNLYFYAHGYQWFTKQEWTFEYDIKPLQTPNKAFFKLYVHERLWGDILLEKIYSVEESRPSLMARHCYYPLIVIKK